MDNKIIDFLLSEKHFGSQLGELYLKLFPLFGAERCMELKLLLEYYNIQMKRDLETAKEYKHVINVYYKQMFYFDLLENAVMCVPYLKRELNNHNLRQEHILDIDDILKNMVENLNSYKVYFKYLSTEVDLHQFESIKIEAILKYILEMDKEISRKLEIGYTINEMMTRENKFISQLKRLLKIFESNPDHTKEIIGVMNKICTGQEEFINDLDKCEWDCNMDLFRLYAEDQRLKSAEVINTLPEYYKDQLHLHNLDLYMCIKHLMPYSIFLEKLEKLAPDVKFEILEIKKEIINVNRQADELFAVANIVRCNVPLNSIGNLIGRGKATFLRKNDHELFLFEQALIITETQSKKTEKQYKHVPEGLGSNPVVYYKTHILKEFLEILPTENNKLEIKINLCVEEDPYNLTIENDIFKECLLQYVQK